MADISYNTAEKILERVKDKAKLKDLQTPTLSPSS